VLGLPDTITTCLFDLDGVLTETSLVHAAAWGRTFDEFLAARAKRTGEPFVAFDRRTDYAAYVDGKRRADGVRDFLASRGIRLPEGAPDDGPDAGTVNGVANRKNELVQQLIRRDGVQVYPGSVAYLRDVRAAGLATGVVSSSANTVEVLRVTGLTDEFDVRVDGVIARELSLPGKPAPDMFLRAAAQLSVDPAQAAVFEDALAGVAAGRAGGFGLVVGVDRLGQADLLREHGADIIVTDLAELRGRS